MKTIEQLGVGVLIQVAEYKVTREGISKVKSENNK